MPLSHGNTNPSSSVTCPLLLALVRVRAQQQAFNTNHPGRCTPRFARLLFQTVDCSVRGGGVRYCALDVTVFMANPLPELDARVGVAARALRMLLRLAGKARLLPPGLLRLVRECPRALRGVRVGVKAARDSETPSDFATGRVISREGRSAPLAARDTAPQGRLRWLGPVRPGPRRHPSPRGAAASRSSSRRELRIASKTEGTEPSGCTSVPRAGTRLGRSSLRGARC